MKNPYNLEILEPIEYYQKGIKLLEEGNEEGIKYLITAGENYYLRAYHNLGMYYFYKNDMTSSVDYLILAAEHGYVDVKSLMKAYAHAYHSGYKSHRKKMLGLLNMIHPHNNIKDYEFLAYVGICKYILGQKEEAGQFLKKAVRKEEGAIGYYHLALCYREGHGVVKDYEYAYTCLMLANSYPTIELIEQEKTHYKRKGFIKKKWKYKKKSSEKRRKNR